MQTSAHTLAFAIALLALYPDEQEILFEHIRSVLSDGRIPVHFPGRGFLTMLEIIILLICSTDVRGYSTVESCPGVSFPNLSIPESPIMMMMMYIYIYMQHTSVIYETLRLFPIVPVIPKESATDTTIVVGNEAGESVVVPILKGTRVDISVAGLHYNRCVVINPTHRILIEKIL
jgi:cytochrome P450